MSWVIALICLLLAAPASDELLKPPYHEALEIKRGSAAESDGLLPADSKLTERDAVELAAEARKRYWHVATGGELPGNVQLFKMDAADSHNYYWFGDDLDTIEEMSAFLEHVYTPEAVQAFIAEQLKEKVFVEFDGRLALLNAGIGSLLDWPHAHAVLFAETANTKRFLVKVPHGGKDGFSIKGVKFRNVEGRGWRIDQSPEMIQ